VTNPTRIGSGIGGYCHGLDSEGNNYDLQKRGVGRNCSNDPEAPLPRGAVGHGLGQPAHRDKQSHWRPTGRTGSSGELLISADASRGSFVRRNRSSQPRVDGGDPGVAPFLPASPWCCERGLASSAVGRVLAAGDVARVAIEAFREVLGSNALAREAGRATVEVVWDVMARSRGGRSGRVPRMCSCIRAGRRIDARWPGACTRPSGWSVSDGRGSERGAISTGGRQALSARYNPSCHAQACCDQVLLVARR
jgi:hypothetical protein